ncbi:hypothetical protein MIMGU_mgv1a019747mg [Erythranthe guttata]|uniref:UBA domain-containing protein n=1 Tax=Erythranthe guttata TaxID=4155 RepID=A0A022QQ60_ERYGU|nr:hypothetical protein MIMGU_mgv1a019747mg [Erythranthe guttata]
MGSGDLPYGGGGDSSSHAAGGEEVTVNVSRLSGSKLNPFKVNLGWTVDFFKSILVEEFEMPIHEQRLIYRGRILKGDKTFQSYGLKSGHTVHLVRNFAAVVVPANSISTAEAGFNKGRGPELPKPEVATNNPAPNINPLPNPWTSACNDTTDDMRLDMLRDMRLHMLRGRETVDGITAPNNSPLPSEELYATQLSQLREMGFVDTQENIRALIAAAGNVNAAVDRLLRDSAK